MIYCTIDMLHYCRSGVVIRTCIIINTTAAAAAAALSDYFAPPSANGPATPYPDRGGAASSAVEIPAVRAPRLVGPDVVVHDASYSSAMIDRSDRRRRRRATLPSRVLVHCRKNKIKKIRLRLV